MDPQELKRVVSIQSKKLFSWTRLSSLISLDFFDLEIEKKKKKKTTTTKKKKEKMGWSNGIGRQWHD